MNKLGCDVSLWQDNDSTPQMMDFDKAKSEGIEFVFIKTSQSNWLDPDYTMNWINAKMAGLPRGGYHYLDWDVPAIEQAKFFAGALKADPGEFPPVLDFEKRTNVPDNADEEAKTFVLEVENILGIKPIIYTSQSYWNEFGNKDSFWTQYKLWIANYYVSEPAIPEPWDKWYIWQFTPKGDGKKYGAESFGLDLNWFNCEQYDWPFDENTEPPVVTPIPPEEVEKFFKIETVPYRLNIRTAPVISNNTKIGSVPSGTVFEVYSEENKDWYKAFCFIHKDYVNKI